MFSGRAARSGDTGDAGRRRGVRPVGFRELFVTFAPGKVKGNETRQQEHKNGKTFVTQTVTVPVTSLCPCSKEISLYGAHNQRSHVTIAARLKGDLSLERQIRYAEESASCELWSRLKRVDEKYVTEKAYENPKFVEDLVRDVAVALNSDKNIEAYRVQAENFESIHNHSAYAQITNGLE